MIYEYSCGGCGCVYEREQSMNDKPDTECGICGSKNVKRLVSGGSGFLLKGEGWFKDGYASKKS